MVQFFSDFNLKEKTPTWPKSWREKESTFPYQNLKVRGQLLFLLYDLTSRIDS